jgi:hypothetical protein
MDQSSLGRIPGETSRRDQSAIPLFVLNVPNDPEVHNKLNNLTTLALADSRRVTANDRTDIRALKDA